jgi:hypothetical protein
MIWGTDAISAGVIGVAAICGAGATCGTGEAGPGWDAGPTGALAAGTVEVVLCCWCTTRVANTPTMATVVARRTSKNLVERDQKRCI